MEQDLVVCRALVEIFGLEKLRGRVAFRGGTALNKLHLNPATRYSEDLDLVQLRAEPIGETLQLIRSVLDPWLGQPKRRASHGTVTMIYRFETTHRPIQRLRLKVEINTREHFSVLGLREVPFSVESRWFRGSAQIITYQLEELLGTKLRALYQRSKGRDLFDLWVAARTLHLNEDQVVQCFRQYVEHEGQRISRAQFEENLYGKQDNRFFTSDVSTLLVSGTDWDRDDAFRYIFEELIARLPGDPWKGMGGA